MKKVHFIGIGGIGLSAIAKFLKEKNYEISGSDISESKIIQNLRECGIKVDVPHNAKNIKDQDVVIYSAAIKENNVELIEAKKRGILSLSRKEALPQVLEGKRVFAVAGAHGKSTTSSMLASLIDSSMIIGAISKEFGSNMRYEESLNLVFEADESDSSFLNSNPFLAIVTNAEPEHMEHYDFDLEKFHLAYKGFLERAKIRVINAEDEFLKDLKIDAIKLYPSKDITDLRVILRDFLPYTSFVLKNLGKFEVFGIGEHIAIDASLAILAANCEIGLEAVRKNLLNYQGIKKRFDLLYTSKNYVLIDDYGHHPTEIKATLKSAKEYVNKLGISKITAIWQPHRYTRLKANLEGFKDCFKDSDDLVILPVYSAGEEPNDIDLKAEFSDKNVIFTDFIQRVGESIEFSDEFGVKHRLDEGVVIGFGAGSISNQLRGI